jgi:AraC family transcriptional regulator
MTMKQEPRIEHTAEKFFVGHMIRMSLVNNRTRELWSGFRPIAGQVNNRVGQDFINLQVYPQGYYENFSPANEYEAYALVEVSTLENIPENLLPFTLPAGDYAVFIHKGGPAAAPQMFQYILSEWLPGSEYQLDNRPHFEVLGEKYSNTDPDSEEEMWLPIK